MAPLLCFDQLLPSEWMMVPKLPTANRSLLLEPETAWRSSVTGVSCALHFLPSKRLTVPPLPTA